MHSRTSSAGAVRPGEHDRLKTQRHNAIRDLLVTAAVSNQDDLRRKLAKRGIHATQATLSRDIRELKLMKGPAGYALPVALEEEDDLPEIADVFGSFALEVRQALNQIVILTVTSGAQPIAASIDSQEWDEVVGTLAGENTVLVICPDRKSADSLRTRLEVLLG